MKKYTDIFAEDIELPGIVNQKMEDAFSKIKTEKIASKDNFSDFKAKRNKSIKLFKNQVAAIASICILILGSITTYAICNYLWSRGMKGTLQATDVQQQTLVEEGVATILQEQEDYAHMAVTDGGVTVIPEMMVVNEKMVYISLSVEGYNLLESQEPCFEFVDVYQGDDPNAEEGWLMMGASFYDGIVPTEDGINVYEDGSPLKFDENGRLISYYADEEGNLEYIVVAMVSNPEDSLLGKTLHINLSNLGTVYKTDYAEDIDGKWNFTFDLPNVSSTKEISIKNRVDDTAFVVDSIEISPVSIKINYSIDDTKTSGGGGKVPLFNGVILEDGTQYTNMVDMGKRGYTDACLSEAYTISSFTRVIDPEQVTAIILETNRGMKVVAVKKSK